MASQQIPSPITEYIKLTNQLRDINRTASALRARVRELNPQVVSWMSTVPQGSFPLPISTEEEIKTYGPPGTLKLYGRNRWEYLKEATLRVLLEQFFTELYPQKTPEDIHRVAHCAARFVWSKRPKTTEPVVRRTIDKEFRPKVKRRRQDSK
jgi:hypothetical protein